MLVTHLGPGLALLCATPRHLPACVCTLPVASISMFYNPPCRLDNTSGTGIHLSPAGVEFDERVVRLGSGLSLRAAASLRFPRQLPIDRDDNDLGIKVHR